MRFLCARDVGIKIRKHFSEHCPRFERSARFICFTRPSVSRKKACCGHVRTTGLKLQNCYAPFGKIKIIIATVEAAQNDITYH